MEKASPLEPNTSNPREMEEFSKIPEPDQQAWLHFVQSSYEKEDLGVAPAYTFDQFVDGKAENIPELLPLVDDLAKNGLGNGPLVSNFDQTYPVKIKDGEYELPRLLDSFKKSAHAFNKAREKGPLALFLPHSSLATPYAGARSALELMGVENADKLNIVIGPRPAVMQFEHYNPETESITSIKPVELGRAIGNVIMTGPNTDSTRNNEELAEWLKELRTSFWGQMDELMEPQDDGNNSVVVFCPAGRVALQKPDGALREYRVDGKFEYVTKYKQLSVMPVGAYDRLLVDADSPESPVILNPDMHTWKPKNDNEAQYIHERAVLLSHSPVGSVDIEPSAAQNLRMVRQSVRRFRGKTAIRPYLSE